MNALVLDTNIVSYLMKGHSAASAYRHHLEGKTLAISFMTVGELYEGAYRQGWDDSKREKLKAEIKKYLVIPYSPRVCEIWGQIRAARKSQPIATDDAWIAATALVYGCPLVTHNSGDFAGVEHLSIITEHKS